MLKSIITLFLLAAICFSNASAQNIFISSQYQSQGTKSSTYHTSSPEDISINFIHTPGWGFDGFAYYYITYASRIHVFVNDVLQFSSGGNLSIIYHWSCTLNNVPSASQVKVTVDFALAVPQMNPYSYAHITVTSQHAYKDITVDLDENSTFSKYSLSQNYPNPFNPNTSIKFNLPVESELKLRVFNLLGEQIAMLADGFYSAGVHSVDFNALNLPSGIYFYRIETKGIDGSSFFETKSMILTK
ncbi:MAG: T9SS type A sorting domain-containing protein [Ignavibacteriaceae bacterium]